MNAESWKRVFTAWPSDMLRRGVLVTSFGEQVPFSGFMIGEDVLMVARSTPDSLGCRALMVPYANIASVKFTDVVKSKSLHAFGLQGDLEKK